MGVTGFAHYHTVVFLLKSPGTRQIFVYGTSSYAQLFNNEKPLVKKGSGNPY
jgi:hypothetical protein